MIRQNLEWGEEGQPIIFQYGNECMVHSTEGVWCKGYKIQRVHGIEGVWCRRYKVQRVYGAGGTQCMMQSLHGAEDKVDIR